MFDVFHLNELMNLLVLLISSFYRTFGCPIMYIDSCSQCYFGHQHL